MSKFCTHCGNSLSADVAFCDACGQAVSGRQTPPPTRTANAPGKQIAPRTVLLGGAATLFLLIAGGAVVLLMPGNEPPTGAALARLLNANTAFLQDKTCLDNFDYAADPVHVSSWDERTQQWLQVLVDAGLYTAPEHVVSNRGIFSQTQLRYMQTPAAKEVVRNGKLCFAAGITVNTIQYAPLQRKNDLHLVRGELSYEYEQAAPWTATPEAKAIQPGRFSQDKHEVVIYLGKQGSEDWRLLSQSEGRRQEQQLMASTTTQAESGSAWKLAEIFSGLFQDIPAAPVMGKWATEKGGTEVHFEFTPDSMMIDGKKTTVSYVVNGNNVTIKSGTPLRDVLALVIVSEDELGVDIGFGRLPLYRMH